MKKFISELRGKTVMTNDGQILGMIDNFLVDTISGEIKNVLVAPADDVSVGRFKSDTKGRLILPFSEMSSARDVVVMSTI